jgi:hypothetical protein
MVMLIVRSEVATALQKRFGSNRSLAVFRDADSLRALQEIFKHRPPVVALDPLFAATSRGASLIARIRADAELSAIDLRLLIVEDGTRMLRLLNASASSLDVAMASSSQPLDWCGTRRAPRFPILREARAALNGEPAQLVNMSASGVQVIFAGRLRPTQGFRLTLQDEERETRLQAVVAWSTLQGSGTRPKYRAGAQFVDSDPQVIEAYCLRYGTIPDRVFVIPQGWSGDAPDADADKSATDNRSRSNRTRRHAG